MHPVREHIPIYLAAVGPKNLELTGEIADGWLAIFFSTRVRRRAARHRSGPAREPVGKTMDGFDVVATVPLVVGDDPSSARRAVRPYAALYIGGMGSREQNFYNALACRMGYADEAAEVQERYLARDYDGAAAAVPAELRRLHSPARPARAHRRTDGRVRGGRSHHAEHDAVRGQRSSERLAVPAHGRRGARAVRGGLVSWPGGHW